MIVAFYHGTLLGGLLGSRGLITSGVLGYALTRIEAGSVADASHNKTQCRSDQESN